MNINLNHILGNTSPSNKHKVNNLGTIRLFLAFLVFYQHNEKLAFGHLTSSWMEGLEVGSLAVLAFFVLSGYVIIGAVDHFYARRPFAFIINRFNRVLPAYVAMVTISMIVLLPLADGNKFFNAEGNPFEIKNYTRNFIDNIIWVIPFGNKFVNPDYVFVPIAWAVRTEVMFYFVVLIILISSYISRIKFEHIGFFLSVIFLILSSIEIFFGLLRFPTFMFSPYFIFGGALYIYRMSNSIFSLFLMIISGITMSAEILTRSPTHETIGFARNLNIQLMITSILIIIIIKGTYQVNGKLDRNFGEYSYPLYICHLLPILVFVHFGALQSPSILWFIASLIVSGLLAALLVNGVERPFARLRATVRKVELN